MCGMNLPAVKSGKVYKLWQQFTVAFLWNQLDHVKYFSAMVIRGQADNNW